MGGYPSESGGRIVDRLLWRGDALHAIDDDGRRTLRGLPLRTVIDLRDDHEREIMPNRLEGVDAEVVIVAMGVGTLALEPGADLDMWRRGELGSFFEMLARTRGPQIATAVSALARPGALPALVHCTAGKDRTGIVIALTLSSLGVADHDIVEDFALSATYLDADFAARTRLAMAGTERGGEQTSDRLFLAAEPTWIAGALAYVRAHHGDAAAYLATHGVDPAAFAALRAALVTSAGTPTAG